MKPTSAQIRQQFIDFFVQKHGHAFVPSSPVVPHDDPTLMFTNAGMNQFKPIFLGTARADHPRVANTQKCIRAGGKHNDLDDVGHDTYHHTFFEMLGNWSFGDYFKREAIRWAWELLTQVWGIDKSRLHATYFGGTKARRHEGTKESDEATKRRSDEGKSEADARATHSGSEELDPDLEARDLWLSETDIDPSHVHPGSMKDNFWEMGDTGPCGPCSEIHIDLTPDKSGTALVNAGDARVMEIWNLVFIQFNRGQDGKLTPLPARHVDTGMGFERICAVIEGMHTGRLGKVSNYDTDVFTPIFAAIQWVTNAPAYGGRLESDEASGRHEGTEAQRHEGENRGGRASDAQARMDATPVKGAKEHTAVMRDVAYRVIADHIRCLTFALTDGALPSNEGRGYVLRRILRRAVRYGRQYLLAPRYEPGPRSPRLLRPSDLRPSEFRPGGVQTALVYPFLCELVSAVADAMGQAFPELGTAHGGRNVEQVASILRDEEGSFGRTLDRGIALFNEAADYARRHHHGRIKGEDAFKLHDTYGFPIDLTELMAQEQGLTVDIGEYERLMEEARDRARRSAGKSMFTAVILSDAPSEFDGYDNLRLEHAQVLQLVHSEPTGGTLFGTEELVAGQEGGIILKKTPFYAEQGGQVGDVGVIHGMPDEWEFEVRDTQRAGRSIVHFGRCTRGRITASFLGDEDTPAAPLDDGVFAIAEVNRQKRVPTARNHTSTHVLNWALREVLGDHVEQKGSLVDPDKTRFDFSHPSPLSEEQLTRIEALVNERIERDLPVYVHEVPIEDKAKLDRAGLRAVFEGAYPARVRVVSIGVSVNQVLEAPENPEWWKYSIEFCGGTHLKSTGEAKRFRLIEESAVAKGIRRVTGVTADRAEQAERAAAELKGRIESTARLNDDALVAAVAELTDKLDHTELPVIEKNRLRESLAALQERARKFQKAQSKQDVAGVVDAANALLDQAERVSGVAIVVGALPSAGADQLRAAADSVRAKAGSAAVLFATESDGKVVLLAAMTPDVIQRGLKAGDLIKEISPLVGGKGGGRPDMAQGGGTDGSKIREALSAAGTWLRAKLA